MEDTNVSVTAPRELSIENYVEARAQEMLSMHRAALVIQGNRQPMQQLPHHMRRRAASHNPKRLPRTLREWAKREMAKAPPSTSKRPSRRHRRRPSNLLQEYTRRQRQHVWLETHIWHAKRFHMTEKWGYKIPLHPNDKGARAAYRATSKYCLLQDVSYYCCIDIKGPEKAILEGLSHLTSPQTGLTFAAKAYLRGTKEGKVCLFLSYPSLVIGEVRFMWKPLRSTNSTSEENCNPDRQLWIWVHPAMYDEVLDALQIVFDIPQEHEKDYSNNTERTGGASNRNLSKDGSVSVTKQRLLKNYHLCQKLKDKTLTKTDKKGTRPGEVAENKEFVSSSKIIENKQFSNGVVNVMSLKDSLCRFHLTGPLSTEVLLDVLKIAQIDHTGFERKEDTGKESVGLHCSQENREGEEPLKDTVWWKDIFNIDSDSGLESIDRHQGQKQFWETVKATESPAELEPHCILGLTVRDPRVFLPRKKSMVSYENKDLLRRPGDGIKQFIAETSWSPLWEENVRMNVKSTKMSDAEMNARRSEALVPGSELMLGESESRVPVVVIQNPGRRLSPGSVHTLSPHQLSQPGYCSGYDLIVPGGWGMAFLIALVYRGARAAGLKEIRTLAVEAGILLYPDNFPDSNAGRHIEAEQWREKQSKYERIPPAKRPSYSKLGVVAPFYYPWKHLLDYWADGGHSDPSQEECVHDEETDCSQQVKDAVGNVVQYSVKGEDSKNHEKLVKVSVLRDRSFLKKIHSACSKSTFRKNGESSFGPPPTKVCRTAKMVSIHHKSFCDVFTQTVVELYSRCLVPIEITMVQRGAPEPFSMICLPDENDMKDFEKDQTYGGPKEPIHKDNSKKQKIKDKPTKSNKRLNKNVLISQQGYPPKLIKNFMCCTRKIIGYVKDGSFSFARGHGYGLGFVALLGLRNLLENGQQISGGMLVLVRSSTSLQYRFACLSIHVP